MGQTPLIEIIVAPNHNNSLYSTHIYLQEYYM